MRTGRWHSPLTILGLLVLTTGCTSTSKSRDETQSKVPQGVPTAPLSQMAQGNSNQIIQASATSVSAWESNLPNTSSFMAKAEKISKHPATQIVATYRNWIDYLPDPAHDGQIGPGIAGQVFLFDSNTEPVQANGTLIVDLYDETSRPPGQQGNIPERWEFSKDKLKTLLSVDERFGPFFVVFLPWPTYRPDVTQVRVKTRYVAEGKTLYAQESRFNVTTAPTNVMTAGWNNETLTGSAAYQRLGASSSPGGATTSMGMGTMTSHGMTANTGSASLASQSAMGITGSQVNGVPSANWPTGSSSTPALPISGVPMNAAPLSLPSNPSGMPSQPGAGNMSSPISNGGLAPIGGGPPGMPPLAFTTSPISR